MGGGWINEAIVQSQQCLVKVNRLPPPLRVSFTLGKRVRRVFRKQLEIDGVARSQNQNICSNPKHARCC